MYFGSLYCKHYGLRSDYSLTQFKSKLRNGGKVLCATHGHAMGNNHMNLLRIWQMYEPDKKFCELRLPIKIEPSFDLVSWCQRLCLTHPHAMCSNYIKLK